MSDLQNIKKQLLPIIKGLPIIIGVFLAALFIARQVIKYSPNRFQTMAKIKLDDQKFGFTGTNLYKDFDVFSSEYKIEAEAELLKSPLIVGTAIDSLNFEIQIYRIGRLKKTLLYQDCPIIIDYSFEDIELFDKTFKLIISEDNSFQCIYNLKGEEIKVDGLIDQELNLGNGQIRISQNTKLLTIRDLQLSGEYAFKIFSRDDLIQDVISRLDVAAVDKEVAVLRVVYKDENPRKMADFTNVLCATYMDDYVSNKSAAANKTLRFIDEKLKEVSKKLSRAEENLEQFKLDNNVVNTLQETETGLREVSKLNLQLINLEMNEKSVLELQKYINTGDYFEETAINFGFGDLLLTELVKKMKLWQDERKDLVIKYTTDSPQVLAVDGKISEVKSYIKEALVQNLKEMQIKRSEIESEVNSAKRMFDNLPTREKSQHILEREFRILEDVFNFLSQKKIESSIAESVQHSFHRIIQHATVPKDSYSPNRTLITFVSGLLGLILGISFIYIRGFVLAKVTCREDLEKNSILPIAGIVRSGKNKRDFRMLAKSILIKESIKKGQTISVTSALTKEGKTFVSMALAETISQMEYSTVLVKFVEGNLDSESGSIKLEHFLENGLSYNSSLQVLTTNSEDGISVTQLDQLNQIFDIVIIDSHATAIDINGIEIMKMADLSLFILRANKSSIRFAAHADAIAEEYAIENIHLVLNDAHKATNYNGNYVGSKFSGQAGAKGLLGRLKSLISIYIKS